MCLPEFDLWNLIYVRQRSLVFKAHKMDYNFIFEYFFRIDIVCCYSWSVKEYVFWRGSADTDSKISGHGKRFRQETCPASGSSNRKDDSRWINFRDWTCYLLPPVKRLLNWRDQLFSNKGDLDLLTSLFLYKVRDCFVLSFK